MREVVRLKYQYSSVYLLCWWNEQKEAGFVMSYEDEQLTNRAWVNVYNPLDKTFRNKKSFEAYVDLLKKRAM